MDYKYIEQLLERYWQCETSLEEESILRAFFHQEDIPLHLLQYKKLFAYQQSQQEVKLGDDFDAKILSKIEKPAVKARRLTSMNRFMPLFKAAAVVAVMLSLGTITQRSFFVEDKLDYNYDTYKDTYNDPQVAYEQISSALMMISEGINKSQTKQFEADSLTRKVESTHTVTE